jgi:hypothetical protein
MNETAHTAKLDTTTGRQINIARYCSNLAPRRREFNGRSRWDIGRISEKVGKQFRPRAFRRVRVLFGTNGRR